MKWLDTSSTEQVAARTPQFWLSMAASIRDGTFWTDRIKHLRGDPLNRLQFALAQLPLPAAFREAALSVRALIRTRLKQKGIPADELALLYWLAAVESFGIAYSEYLRQPGYNVLESVPGEVIKSLQFSYVELGYGQLSLLTKKDIKLLVRQWGEPDAHTTLNAMHRSTWESYERKLAASQQIERNRVMLGDGG